MSGAGAEESGNGPEARASGRFASDGFVVIRSLFSAAEAESLRDHFMTLRAAGSYPGDNAGTASKPDDPLRKYPRMIHMHRWDETSLRWLMDPRLRSWTEALLGIEPFAVQTMLYFKPPGARGQLPHQDNFFLKVQPGTCLGAWLALDPADVKNGCLHVVPGTHRQEILCPEKADLEQSFSRIVVPIPDRMTLVPLIMAPGDVLFFHGSLIHGSFPNRSRKRFRRSLVGHYISAEAAEVSKFYHPVLRMDGTEVALGESELGGPCGLWTEEGGAPAVKTVSRETGFWDAMGRYHPPGPEEETRM